MQQPWYHLQKLQKKHYYCNIALLKPNVTTKVPPPKTANHFYYTIVLLKPRVTTQLPTF